MPVSLIVGTPKGAAVLASEDREIWREDFALPGWPVTASARDDRGRVYAAVNSPNYGVAIFVSDDMRQWTQLAAAPRYRPEDRGNAEHHRIVSQMDFSGLLKSGGRFVDQIWTLHWAHGALYAGVSEAGLFVSRDRGASWQPVDGFNNHPSRESWTPGFGGLGAHSILSDAKNPDRMWVGVSAAGLFRTDDGGKSWEPKNKGVNPAIDSAPASTGQCVHHLAHDPDNAEGNLPPGTSRGAPLRRWRRQLAGDGRWPARRRTFRRSSLLLRFRDGDGPAFGQRVQSCRWRATISCFPRGKPACRLSQLMTAHAGRRTKAACRTNVICRSVLRGAMAADQNGGLYFGTASGTIYASGDLGESWREVASGLPRIQSVEAFAT